MDRYPEREQEIVRPTTVEAERRERRREAVAKTFLGTSTTEAVIGAGAGVLGILGLIGIFPLYMATIGIIGIGATLLVEGGGIASRYSQLSELNGGRTLPVVLGGGTSAEVLGGLAGITLGILALVGVAPMALLPVAIIIYGGALIFGTSATARATSAFERDATIDRARYAAHEAVVATEGARLLVGLGVVTLGILVLAEVGLPMVLTLVSVLALGGVTMLSGSAMSARSGMTLH